MEFNKYGFWQSNPLGKHPEWKWEGYPEYIARQGSGFEDLKKRITLMLKEEKRRNTGWMLLPDGTEILTTYFGYMILIQYCLEIKKFSFVRLLENNTSQETLSAEMLSCYNNQIK
jgi:hypothetical protein